MSRRGHGDGAIDQRGENSWRLRYRINGKRYSKAFRGTLSEARKELRALIRSCDFGTHVEPNKITVAEWIERWIASGTPGRSQKKAGHRTVERYSQLLRCHVVPILGSRRLQQLQATEIDELYVALAGKLKPRTAHHVHIVLGACLGTATRKGLLMANPMARVEQVPSPGESNHGLALDADALRKLIDGFRGSVLFPIVATAALTGARRNEILALRWADFDPANRTLRIERALEETKEAGLYFKPPKTKRGTRTITIDDDLVALLTAEREKHLRIMAGVSESAAVDLSLVRLPEGALMFPSPAGAKFDFTRPRDPVRGSHETALLDAGVPTRGHPRLCQTRSQARV
jgi:integrase